MDEILHQPRNLGMMIPLQIQTSNGFPWFQTGAEFRQYTVGRGSLGEEVLVQWLFIVRWFWKRGLQSSCSPNVPCPRRTCQVFWGTTKLCCPRLPGGVGGRLHWELITTCKSHSDLASSTLLYTAEGSFWTPDV